MSQRTTPTTEQLLTMVDQAAHGRRLLPAEAIQLRGVILGLQDAKRSRGQHHAIVSMLRTGLDRADAERLRLAAALRDVLAQFSVEGHPGAPCLRTPWVAVTTVDRWRTALDGLADTPADTDAADSASTQASAPATADTDTVNTPPPTPVDELTHLTPAPGHSKVPCCSRVVFELPRFDRMTVDPAAVTCPSHQPSTPVDDPADTLLAASEQQGAQARHAEQLDAEARERTHLLAWLAALHPGTVLAPAPAADVTEPDWWILYLTAGSWRQTTWPIHPDDLPLFAGVPRVDAGDHRAQWDGHTTEAKYRRMRAWTERLHRQPTTGVDASTGTPNATAPTADAPEQP